MVVTYCCETSVTMALPARRLCLALLNLALTAGLCHGAVLVDWDFTRGSQGWTDEAGSTPDRRPEGTLWPGSAAGISLRSPALQLTTEAFQALELSARCERPGVTHLLWYGAAFGRKQASWQGPLPVDIPADGRNHDLRLLPFWQNVKTLEALRLVAAPGTRLRLNRLRVTGSEAVPVDQPVWDLGQQFQAGQWLTLGGGLALRPEAGSLQVALQEASGTLISPPLDTVTYRYEWLAVELTSDQLQSVRGQWATSGQKGLHGETLYARPGRRFYNIRCGVDRSWIGVLRGLGLELTGAPNTTARVHQVRLADLPQGPADLQTLYAGSVENQPRAGKPFRFVWVLCNQGGQEAAEFKATLDPGTATILHAPASLARRRLDFGVPEVLVWELQARGPCQMTLQAEGGGHKLQQTVSLPVAPTLPSLPWSRVAPPRLPDLAGASVAALYRTPPPAPLGPEMLRRRLYQRPCLGDYNPQPEVMDWQIKWSREHGLSTWVFDLGGDDTGPAERSTVDAFLGATFSRQMGFCFRWTARTPTVAAGQELFGREIAPLLQQPNYLRLKDKPVVLVANPLVSGAEGTGLSDLRDLAASTGLVFIACLPPAAVTAELLQRAGYLACCDLYSDLSLPRGPSLVEEWEAATRDSVPHLPSLQPALAAGLLPDRLKTLVRLARLRTQRADSHSLPLVMLGDFNGPQGIEPDRQRAWGHLEALREATGAPPATHLVPEDVGLGPYDRPLPLPPDHWEFDTKDSWTSAMGLSVLRIAHGQLTARTDTESPALFGGDTILDTRLYHTVAIGLAASAGSQGRLWWRTSLRKLNLEHSLPFALTADGAVHEYRLKIGEHPGWRGLLESLRLDPTDAVGASVALDYIRLLPTE